MGIITGPSDITYNEDDKSVTVQPIKEHQKGDNTDNAAGTSLQGKMVLEDQQFTKVTDYIAAVMENAVDRQNDILNGLSDIIKDCFIYMKEKDAKYEENQLTEKHFSRIIHKQSRTERNSVE